MSSPTKLNSGSPSSRPVTTNIVTNAENRDVEREQLNRILSSFADRINSVETTSGSSGSVTFAITNNDGTITVVSNGNTFVIGIADGGVGTTQLANNSVTTAKIADDAVTTVKIDDDAVTFGKFQNITSDRLLGRDTTASGNVEEISLDTTLEFTGSQVIRRAALSGDVSASAGSNTTTLATVNANVGSFGSGTQVGTFTVNGKGLVTAASNTTISIPASAISDSTTVGRNLLTAPNPSAIRFIRINADNSVTFQTAANFRTDLGLGTIATQNANSVTITGGTINGTTIGATTRSTIQCTTLNANGNATLGDAITDSHTINGGLTVRMPTGNATQAYIDFSIPNTAGTGPNFGGRIYSVSEGTTDFSDNSIRLAAPIGASATPVDHIKCKAGTTSVFGTLSCTGNATLGDGTGDAHTANGSLNVTTTTTTATYFAVDTVFTTDANTGTQDINVDLANGSIQKCTRNGNHTLNITGTGLSSKHLPSCTIYIYLNTTGANNTTLGGSNILPMATFTTAIGAISTRVIHGFWDGSNFYITAQADFIGDKRPS